MNTKNEEKIVRVDNTKKTSRFQDKKGKHPLLDVVFYILDGLLFLWDMGKTLVIVIAVAFVIRFYLIQPFYVEGSSMMPNFENGEYLLIDEISYHFRAPIRGEVIVFHPPIENTYQNYIKRIIALPKESITFDEPSGYTVEKQNSQTEYRIEEPYLAPDILIQKNGAPPVTTLTDNQYFVMGDNRTASSDSRVFGPVNEKNITGKVWFYIKTEDWYIGKFKMPIPKIKEMGRIQTPNYNIDKNP